MVLCQRFPAPDETVWSLRASDIYQGGETEPLLLTERARQPSRR